MGPGGPDTRAVPARQAEAKVCPGCGQGFQCLGLQPGCWCAQASLSPGTLAALRAQYADCVCPACLAAGESRTRPLVNALPLQAKIE
ncbi:MAG: cysteine-rich CWC family protein [Candidatus Binataceae bacterium]